MSDKQFKILRNVQKHQNLYLILKKSGYDGNRPGDFEAFQKQLPDPIITYITPSDTKYDENTRLFLTPYAESLLDDLNRSDRRFRIPLVISVIALIGGYRQELSLLLQALLKLLRHVMGD